RPPPPSPSRPAEPAQPGAPACRLPCSFGPSSGVAHQCALSVEPIGDHLNLALARGAGDAAAAGGLKPELGQHPGGRWIIREMRGGECGQSRIGKAMPHYGVAGFSGIALAPPRPPEPEAEFGDAGGSAIKAHATNQLPPELDAEAHLPAHWLEPAHGLSGREWIGDVARHGGHGPVARKACKLLRIGHAKRAQEETLCR